MVSVKGRVSVLSVMFWCWGLAQRVVTLVELMVTLVELTIELMVMLVQDVMALWCEQPVLTMSARRAHLTDFL